MSDTPVDEILQDTKKFIQEMNATFKKLDRDRTTLRRMIARTTKKKREDAQKKQSPLIAKMPADLRNDLAKALGISRRNVRGGYFADYPECLTVIYWPDRIFDGKTDAVLHKHDVKRLCAQALTTKQAADLMRRHKDYRAQWGDSWFVTEATVRWEA